jgi:hypothetical protein
MSHAGQAMHSPLTLDDWVVFGVSHPPIRALPDVTRGRTPSGKKDAGQR